MNHDPDHPYLRSLVGCGHGVLFTDHCRDCEVTAAQDRYRAAVRAVQHCRNELRRLGEPLPGETITREIKTPKTWPFPDAEDAPL